MWDLIPPHQGSNQGALCQEHRVLTTRPPRKSLEPHLNLDLTLQRFPQQPAPQQPLPPARTAEIPGQSTYWRRVDVIARPASPQLGMITYLLLEASCDAFEL